MAKISRTRAPCPCCRAMVDLERQSLLNSPSKVRAAAAGKYFEFIHSKQDRYCMYWACNECFQKKRAIKADHRKQKWCDCEAYFAYFDETRTCVDCGESFVFTKEEQKHWYETLQFWVWSRPIRCKPCNSRRKRKPIGALPVKPTSLDPGEIARYLVELEKHPRTPERVKLVEAYLGSESHGVQVVAAKVLVTWQCHRSLPKLVSLYLDSLTNDDSLSRSTALKSSILRLLNQSGHTHFIKSFLAIPKIDDRALLLPFFESIDPCCASRLFESAEKNADPDLIDSILHATERLPSPKEFREAHPTKDDWIWKILGQ